MNREALLQSISALPDAAACGVLAQRIHELCGAGTSLIVGRAYAPSGEPLAFVAYVLDVHGVGPQATGMSERAALEALLQAFGESSLSR